MENDTAGAPILAATLKKTSSETAEKFLTNMLNIAEAGYLEGYALVAVVDMPGEEGLTYLTQLDPGDAGLARLYYAMDWCKSKMFKDGIEENG